MNKILRVVIVLLATAVYLGALRFFVGSPHPYFLLGIAIVGLTAWILGAVWGLVMALALIPMTDLVYGNYVIGRDFMKLAISPPYILMQVLSAVGMGYLRLEKKLDVDKEQQLAEVNDQLQVALSQVQELGGVHSLCGACKKIMDDHGDWRDVDEFLSRHTKMEFSHCVCPECAEDYKKQAEQL